MTRSTKCAGAFLAIITAGIMGCDATPTSSPDVKPQIAAPSTASHDVQSNVYTSGSNVTAYDPIPGGTDTNWGTNVCTNTPSGG